MRTWYHLCPDPVDIVGMTEFNGGFLSMWVDQFGKQKPDRAAVEWVPTGRKFGVNKDHLRECGRVQGVIQARLNLTPSTPTPAEWRRKVFGLRSNLRAKQADAAILRLLPALVTLPAGIPPWVLKHLPDASGVALSLGTP